MLTKTLISYAFDRSANAAAIFLVAASFWYFLSFTFFLLALIGFVIFFVVGVRPPAKRNKKEWDRCFPRQQLERVQLVNGAHHWREWQTPCRVIVHSEKRFGVLSALPCWNHEAFDNAALCVALPSQRVLPLARYVLWLLGGVLPVSRSVLLRLLGVNPGTAQSGSSSNNSTPSSSPARAPSSGKKDDGFDASSSVVVAFHDGPQIKVNAAEQTTELEVTTKHMISAALKAGAAVAPAVQMPEGTIFIGKPQTLRTTSDTDSTLQSPSCGVVESDSAAAVGGPIETPTTEQVLAASDHYCEMLSQVMKKSYPTMEAKVRR